MNAPETPAKRRLRPRWRFQYSLAALLSVVIFINLGLAIYYTLDNYRFPSPAKKLKGQDDGDIDVIAFSADGRRALSAGPEFRLWDVETGRELKRLVGHKDLCTAVFSPDGKQALSGDVDGRIALWDLEKGHVVKRLSGDRSDVTDLAFSPDGKRALSANAWITGSRTVKTTVRLWDLESGREIRKFDGEMIEDGVLGLAFSPDGKRAMAVSLRDGTIVVWDLESGRKVKTLTPRAGSLSVSSAAFSPDGRHVLLGTRADGGILRWDLERDHETVKLVGHKHDVRTLAFSPDYSRALSASLDLTIRVWDLGSGKEIRRLRRRGRRYVGAFSPDGRWVLTGGEDGVLELWDLERGAPLLPLAAAIAATIAFTCFLVAMKIRARRREQKAPPENPVTARFTGGYRL